MTWKTLLVAHGVAAAAVATVVASAPEASAAPTQQVYYDYYNNSNFDTKVGEKWVMSCSGFENTLLWGRTSRYYKQETSPCVGSAPPVETCYIDNVLVLCP